MSKVTQYFHKPVMVDEVINSLDLQPHGIYLDCTFGFGGYTTAILQSKLNCKVIGIDQDPNVIPIADSLLNQYPNNFIFEHGNFRNLKQIITNLHSKSKAFFDNTSQDNNYQSNQYSDIQNDEYALELNGIIFDLGVSSMQLDDESRGFSFSKDSYLDMRMSCSGVSASEWIQRAAEEEIADILYMYGDEHESRKIAKNIVLQRKLSPIDTTLKLANIVSNTLKHRQHNKIHPATKTFQAIRVHINKEFESLELALKQTLPCLKYNGKLVVVTFHSSEDKIVKKYIKANMRPKVSQSKYAYLREDMSSKVYKDGFDNIHKVLTPSRDEVLNNPRSRSAKLRYSTKIKYSV